MRVEEFRGHRDQLGDLALVVLELEDLCVALEIVEVVDRAHRELALQVSPDDRDLRLVERRMVGRRMVEELAPLRRELAVVREREPLENAALLLRQLVHRILGLVDDLVGRHLLGLQAKIRGEWLDDEWRRGGCRGARARRRRRRRTGQPVEKLSPGRSKVAPGDLGLRRVDLRSIDFRGVVSRAVPGRSALRRNARIDRARSARLEA